MSLVERIYSFTFIINKPNVGLFTKIRTKIPRHPYESLYEVYARALSFAHSYRTGLHFGPGRFKPEEPSLSVRDILGNCELWVYVGVPEKKTFDRALRRPADGETRIYLWQRAQILELLKELRTSLLKAKKRPTIFQIDEKMLEIIGAHESTSPIWTYTQTEDEIFLDADGMEVHTTIQELDVQQLLYAPLEEFEGGR